MDSMSKIFSYVINVHCLNILDNHGKNIILMGRPRLFSANGIFIIKFLFNMRKNYNLSTFIAFFDIIMTFDTDGNELLIKGIGKIRISIKVFILY